MKKIRGSMEGQMHFEFHEWKECFEAWRMNIPIYGDDLQLIISTHGSTSGYWIEDRGKEYSGAEKCYTDDEVLELEIRVTKEIELAKQEGRHPKIVF